MHAGEPSVQAACEAQTGRDSLTMLVQFLGEAQFYRKTPLHADSISGEGYMSTKVKVIG